MSINCNLEKNDSTQPLTVGAEFFVLCEGDLPQFKDQKSVELRVEKADQYKLKLLQFEQVNSKQWSLKFVSYQVGEHNLQAVQLTDPEQSAVLGDLKFTVASVIKPEEPIQEPFGQTQPVSATFPLSILLLVGFGVLFFLASVMFFVLRSVRRRHWLQVNRAVCNERGPEQETYFRLREIYRLQSSGEEFINKAESLLLLQFSWWCNLPAPQLGLKTTVKKLSKVIQNEKTLVNSRSLAKELLRWKQSQNQPTQAEASVIYQMLSELIDELQKNSFFKRKSS